MQHVDPICSSRTDYTPAHKASVGIGELLTRLLPSPTVQIIYRLDQQGKAPVAESGQLMVLSGRYYCSCYAGHR
jgi:hypothetical protein